MYNDQSNFMHQFWKVEGLSTTEWKMSAMGAMMMVLGNGGADLILWQCPSKCLLSYTCIYAFRYFKLLKITYTMHTIVWTNFNFRYMYIIYHTGPNNPELVYLQMSIFIPFLFIFCHNIFWIYYMILLWSKCLFCINCIVLVKVMSQLKYCSIETWQLIESKLSESIF